MARVPGRFVNKVTYAPIRPSPEDVASGRIEARRRGLEKVMFANALRATPAEVEASKTQVAQEDRAALVALDAIGELAKGGSRGGRDGWREIGRQSPEALIKAGRAVAAHRRVRQAELREAAEQLVSEHAAETRKSLEATAGGPRTAGRTRRANAPAIQSETMAVDPRLSSASLRPNLRDAVEWARVRQPARLDRIVELARDAAQVRTDFDKLVAVDWDRFAEEVVGGGTALDTWTDDLTDGFRESMSVEPIGRLHLERVEMTPMGVVRGELMHSLCLAPKETVTLIHREWSSRETSFEKVVSEEFEQSTEEGVTENIELASATETQSRHSSQLSMEATATGSYGFASASMTFGYTTTSDNEETKRDSRNHAIEVTRKASARTRKEHKVTFTVKEQAGVEDQSVRTLANPSADAPMRIDFHQMIRDWQVDLYRYGIRLTYDIVVPAPGIDLLAKVDALQRLEHQLSAPFSFSLVLGDITRDNWPELAANYGVELTPPDPAQIELHQELAFPHRGIEEAKPTRFDTLVFDLPEGYSLNDGDFLASFVLHVGGNFELIGDPWAPIGHNDGTVRFYETTLEHLKDRTGRVTLVMVNDGVEVGYARATVRAVQGAAGWRAWQTYAWNALRKGAETAWQSERQALRERRDGLSDEIGRWDPLTLRRMEREEIMKTTLKWIFGPAFDLMPSEVTRLFSGDAGGLQQLEPAGLTVEQWSQAMGLGEFIKFIHQAIEWENVLYFIYPYFWDNPRNHAVKRFLQHPDSTHQAFLRGGAARVVLTVRPGFEKSFTTLFETAALDEELTDHPYMTIAEEIRAHAETHYAGIPGTTASGEPDRDLVEAAERGEHIARWHEYTPISALDMTINTPLDQLK